jgi:hypothetical protein
MFTPIRDPVNAENVVHRTGERPTGRAWQMPYAIRIDSLTKFQHTWANGDDLTVEDFITDAQALDAEALRNKQAIALLARVAMDMEGGGSAAFAEIESP